MSAERVRLGGRNQIRSRDFPPASYHRCEQAPDQPTANRITDWVIDKDYPAEGRLLPGREARSDPQHVVGDVHDAADKVWEQSQQSHPQKRMAANRLSQTAGGRQLLLDTAQLQRAFQRSVQFARGLVAMVRIGTEAATNHPLQHVSSLHARLDPWDVAA